MPIKTIQYLDCHLYWQSEYARHEERYLVKANLWRDLWPQEVAQALTGAKAGDRFHFIFPPGSLVPKRDEAEIRKASPKRFKEHQVGDRPRLGRFYPRGVFNLIGFFGADIRPTRIIKLTEDVMVLDLNHPLADRELKLEIEVLEVVSRGEERGGRVRDWIEILLDGPGIQARWKDTPTDFGGPKAQRRTDPTPDCQFYSRPGVSPPIDQKAASLIRELLEKVLPPGPVLELFCPGQSLVPPGYPVVALSPCQPQVKPGGEERIIQDLNKDPRLPFKDGSFAAAVINLTLPYLLRPFALAREVARVLKPKGVFIMTFTDRYLPTRATELWIDLHPFERMGYALEILLESGSFGHLETYSARGFPRPAHDPLFPQRREADPVFAVWGKRL